jgi:hypothetical protein
MNRFRGLALLALGCVLAVAAASTGPFLEADRDAPPFPDLLRRGFRVQVQRGGGEDGAAPAAYRVLGVAFETIAVLVLVAAALYGLYRLVKALLRLREMLRARSLADRRTAPYDPGEESRDDAETALRKRVADELRLLSVDLDADVDPREAVIACYVRMENALAQAGTPRAATDTPLELMARALGAFDVPRADVRRLTALFTEARFSSHPVTDEMRAAARRSLAAVADALAVRA